MATYSVHLYNVPKLTPDAKDALPVAGPEVKDFEKLEEAQSFASGRKSDFDRVMLLRTEAEGFKLVERYRDGQHERGEDIVRR